MVSCFCNFSPRTLVRRWTHFDEFLFLDGVENNHQPENDWSHKSAQNRPISVQLLAVRRGWHQSEDIPWISPPISPNFTALKKEGELRIGFVCTWKLPNQFRWLKYIVFRHWPRTFSGRLHLHHRIWADLSYSSILDGQQMMSLAPVQQVKLKVASSWVVVWNDVCWICSQEKMWRMNPNWRIIFKNKVGLVSN